MSGEKLLVVSDTNIFIDLIDLDLYPHFMKLGYTVHTNIFVLNELKNSEQRAVIDSIGGVIVEPFDSPNFFLEINKFFNDRTHSGLSFIDCSVLYQGIVLEATVLTGDKKMIKSAMSLDIQVRGILFIFDQLVEQKLISPAAACEKLKALYERNRRLPKDEIDKRLNLWGKVTP